MMTLLRKSWRFFFSRRSHLNEVSAVPADEKSHIRAHHAADNPGASQHENEEPQQGRNELSRVLAEFKVASQPGNERQVIERVAECIADLHIPAELTERLKTAVAEATMNAMEHGNHYQPDLAVEIVVTVAEFEQDAQDLVVRIRDFGGGQDIPESETPDLEAKLEGRQTPRGWGLFLIKNMVDEMRVTTDETYHTVELILHLKGAG